jgi:restriction system protein
MEIGDVVICPKGEGKYYVGEISSEYQYVPGELLPHRRRVTWWKEILDKSQFSVDLRNSMGSIGTVSNISKYATELTAILEGKSAPSLIATDENVEDASVFALEKHLEDFLVANWSSTELSKSYDIYEEGGELVGQQFPTDTGPIDILAISKDRKELLVIELKKGRVSDVVVGQIQRYMGFVTTELAEENQKVKGIIIGLEDDLKLKRALTVTQNIDFYKYQVSFKLFKS